MENKLFWLAFRVGDQIKLSLYRCDTRQQAIHHGLEHVLDRKLIAVFSEDVGLSVPQMLELAPTVPLNGSMLLF